MNSSTRIELASGMVLFCKLAAASLNETSLTLRENVEKAFSRVLISGCGVAGGATGFLMGASSTNGVAALLVGGFQFLSSSTNASLTSSSLRMPLVPTGGRKVRV